MTQDHAVELLLVEDNPEDLELALRAMRKAVLVQRSLVTLGYEVEFITNAAEALSRVTDDPLHFDLVLTDQTMTAMTGLVLASERLRIRPTMRVIVMTGYTAPLMAGSADAVRVASLFL